jgi:hypothetical protein
MAPETNLPANLSPVQASVLNVLCAFEEIPKTKKALADEIGKQLNLHPVTVAHVMRSPVFRAAYQDICLATAHIRMNEVMERTVEAAISKKGKAADRILYFKLMGLLERKKPEEKPKEPVDNPEELERKKAEIQERLRVEQATPTKAEVRNVKK